MNTTVFNPSTPSSRQPSTPPPRDHSRHAALALTLLCFAMTSGPLRAGPVVDQNAGYFLDGYADNSGIASASQVQVSGGAVSLVPLQAAGNYRTVQIVPTSFSAWDELTFAPNFGALNDLQAEVRSQDGSTVLIPAQPVNAPINLSGLNPATVPGIRVQVYFNKFGQVAPSVDSLRVTWVPKSQLLLDKQGPATVQAGGSIVYGIRYSVNYVAAQKLVIYDSLASGAAGTLVYPVAQYPGQNDDLAFVTANKGGQYTSAGMLVDGVAVPPNSVFWKLGDVAEGVTDLLSVTVATKNGTLNGTRATNCAYAAAANAASATSCVVTVIHSAPAPLLRKQQGAGIFNINGVLQTQQGTVNTFNLTAQNQTGLGRETMYNTVVYDNLTGLLNVIVDQPPAGPSASDFSNITPAGGVFDPAFDADGPGGAAPFPAIRWNAGTLVPGQTFFASFSVQLQPNPTPAQYSNFACVDSDQSPALCDSINVRIGLDQTPTGSFAKGDNASGFFSIKAQFNDNPSFFVPYGGTVGFALSCANSGLSKLNDLVFLDQIPANTTFNSAWFNDANLDQSGARIFYSTSAAFPNANNPPPILHTAAPADLDAGANNFWEPYDSNPPANPAAVKWVAFYLHQLDSVLLPNQGTPAGQFPVAPITTGVGYFDVKVFTPANQCTDTLITNYGIFRVFESTDLNTNQTMIGGGGITVADGEQVFAKGYIGNLVVAGASSITPNPVQLPANNSIYTVTLANSSVPTSDALANVQVTLQLCPVTVNGVPQFPSVQSISPAGSYNAGSGQITIALGQMLPGATRTITVGLGLPAGILDGTPYCVKLDGIGFDDQCGSSRVTDNACGQVQSSPKLSVHKSEAADLIPSGATYDYQLVYQNLGTGPSTGTWIVDRVPAKTVLVRAFGNPTISGVWFSTVDNLPPQALTPFNPITASIIANNFALGVFNNNGTPGDPTDDFWLPTGANSDDIYWVAWQVDEPTLNPPQLAINAPRTVGFRVQNDDDGQGPGTAGSPQGTCLLNSAAIFSSELLQAIGNQVITKIDDSPSILVQKIGPVVVEAGVDFTWVVAYHNNTLQTPDQTVDITDTLPPGITFVSATHQWNAVAAANGAPGGVVPQPVTPGIVNNLDGSTSLTFPIAGAAGYRGPSAALLGLEGGVIKLTVRSDAAAPCGSTALNSVCGTANTLGEIKTSCADHQVTILCPDLQLQKFASPASVLPGGTLTYQVVVANLGGIAARDVVITDLLPPNVAYVAGSVSVSPGYSIGAPAISGQMLTWSVANGNALTQTGFPAGEVPANSGNIILQFNVQVAAGVAPCTALDNVAQAATASVDAGVYPNSAGASAFVPPPELSVAKTGPPLALPGSRIAWNVSWVNNSPAPATGVYLVETLPSNDADANSDVTFVSVTLPAGVTAYYHSGPVSPVPSFTPATPLAGGWSAAPVPPVNHVALDVGALAGNSGPFTAQVTVDLIDPGTGARPDAGVCYTNSVVIHQVQPGCENTADNTATAKVCTPSLDLSLRKTGSAQGLFPGIAPGQPITYTIEFENSGTVPARGVTITDTLPAGLLPGSPLDNFGVVTLVDALGNPCFPLNLADVPITGVIPVSRQLSGGTITWFLGSDSSADPLYYQNLRIPPGCRGSFQLYVTVAGDVPDNTEVCNHATVSVPPELGVEELLANNTGRSCVTVRRADVAVNKSAVETSSGDPAFVEFGGLITYTVCYNNLGSIDALNTVIHELVPDGTSLVSVNPPAGATVSYFPDPATATSFDVNLGALRAPANAVCFARDTNVLEAAAPPLNIQMVSNAVRVTWAPPAYSPSNPPVLLHVTSRGTSNKIFLSFSKPLEPMAALDAFIYSVSSVSGGAAITSVAFSGNTKTVVLMVAPDLELNQEYTVTVTSVTDPSGNTIQPDPSSLSFTNTATGVPFVDPNACVLESTPRLTPPILWTPVPGTPTIFPNGTEGYTFPRNQPQRYFRLRCPGVEAPRCTPGFFEHFINPDVEGFLGWGTLFVTDTVPPGATACYSIGRTDGTNIVYDLGPDYTSVKIGAGGLSLSGVPTTATRLVLRAEFTSADGTNSPCLDAFKVTYESTQWPCFTFTVRVDGRGAEDCGPLPIDNTVIINTTTPEITTANNSASYHMDTRLTDLTVDMAVDKAAALPGETLTHTLNWSVFGPQAATAAYLQVALPDGNLNGVADVTLTGVGPGVAAYRNLASTLSTPVFNPNNPTANGWIPIPPAFASLAANHLVVLLGNPAPGASGTITYTATINAGAAGQTLNSSVTAFTSRRETDCDNSDSVVTYVGRLANVHAAKTGPGCLHPGNLAVFQINYGNNGNTAAVNVAVSDVLPAGLIFVSAVPAPGSIAGQNLTWDNLGAIPGTLAPGEAGIIIVTAQLADDCALIGRTLVNVATITTSDEQVSLADDRAPAVLDCITPDFVSLGGYVYHDRNGDCLREPGESGIPGVTITLTGIVPCGSPVTLVTVTDGNGQYSFTGLPPGAYTVTETQPASWISTGDALGTINNTPRGSNPQPLDNVLGPILLNGGELAVEYNFCENRPPPGECPDFPCVFLVIDEDCIDNTSPGYYLPPNTGQGIKGRTFKASHVNDDLAAVGLRTPLRYFNTPTNFGRRIILRSGQVGDEGLFAVKEWPDTWVTTGPTSDGLRNYTGLPCDPFPHDVGLGLGRGNDPEIYLDKIPRVTPLRATGLAQLVGFTVCAVVYDSDISINYSPLNGNLHGANLGVVAFKVIEVKQAVGFSSSTLPLITVEIVDPCAAMAGPRALFLDAPEPASSSAPFDIAPPPTAPPPTNLLAILHPRLTLQAQCPPQPTPLGGQVVISATVSNAGDITITNILIVTTQPVSNTVAAVVGRLAPRESASFSYSFGVPTSYQGCNITELLRAEGRSTCGSLVPEGITNVCPVACQAPGQVFLVIDEDCLDNATPGYYLPPNTGQGVNGQPFSASDVNDDIAAVGRRTPLSYFNDPANFGRHIVLRSGEVGDEGLFAVMTLPMSWADAGPTGDGWRNYVGQPCQAFPHDVGPGLGWGNDPEVHLLDVPRVTPLRARGLANLVGLTVCAVVYDSDINVNYEPLVGSLQGASLGVVAFKVVEVKQAQGFSSGTLPLLTVEIVDPCAAFAGQVDLFLNAPEPDSASEPYDIHPSGPVVSAGFNNAAGFAPAGMIVGGSNTGRFSLSFGTEPNIVYAVEYCTELPGAWQPLLEVLGTGRPALITDPNAGGPARFYRVITKPFGAAAAGR
jgi:uncharacterized repeat protein (TIGR01451 family)